MRMHQGLVLASWFLAGAWLHVPVVAQEAPRSVPCRDRPCALLIDWTREGGVTTQVPDRRYGNPAQLEQYVKARLIERGFGNHSSTDEQDLKIVLVPTVRSAMCDELPGTSTDMSCNAIAEVQGRVDGPDEVRRDFDLPSRIRNRCPSDKVMRVDELGVFIADWIIYALEGKSKGERRPVARC